MRHLFADYVSANGSFFTDESSSALALRRTGLAEPGYRPENLGERSRPKELAMKGTETPFELNPSELVGYPLA